MVHSSYHKLVSTSLPSPAFSQFVATSDKRVVRVLLLLLLLLGEASRGAPEFYQQSVVCLNYFLSLRFFLLVASDFFSHTST